VYQVSAYVSSCLQATGHHTGKPLRIPGSEMAKVKYQHQYVACCCSCLLSTLRQIATDGQEQVSLKRWLTCCCMQVDTSQKNFTLQEASLKVKVEDGQIQEINVSIYQLNLVHNVTPADSIAVDSIGWCMQMMPTKGAGFTGLYEALGGRVPSAF